MLDAKKKFFLFKQSSNFCSVPWNYFKIDVDGQVTTCVHGLEKLGNIRDSSMQEILSGPKIKEIRRSLYQDQMPSNCRTCRALDNNKGKSYHYLRDMYNDWFKGVDVDYSDPDAFHFSGVDLHWSNTCNAKCITCWPRQSSSIAQELKIPIVKIDRDHTQKYVDWILCNQSEIKEIYFSGGEPSQIKQNIKLLEGLESRSDLLLRINTNMSFDDSNRFINLVMSFPNVLFTMSADALGDRFAYIRQGISWTRFLTNLDRLAASSCQLRINSVFFVASAWTLLETQEFFLEKYGISDFTINQCSMEKDSLLCRNLPDAVKHKVVDDIDRVLANTNLDLNTRGQLANCKLEIMRDPNGLDYRDFFEDIDQRRGTNWKDIFKELT